MALRRGDRNGLDRMNKEENAAQRQGHCGQLSTVSRATDLK